MLQVLDAGALRRFVDAGTDALRAAREEVDGLNVYPVPDGDTGTNLLMTLQSVQEAVGRAAPDLAATVAAVVHGALVGARGNSGVLVSQVLRGLVEPLTDVAGGAREVRAGLARGAELARACVAVPVEGTMLSVAQAAADGALGDDLASVVRSAREAAEQALARTPDQLAVLREAGVVDAGGRGLCVLLCALEQVVTGVPVPGVAVPVEVPPPLVGRPAAGPVERESGSAAFGYEVQYLLRDSTEEAVAALSARLGELGDSVVVVGTDGLWNVHVHVDDVGAALEAGLDAGRPFRVGVTRFADQGVVPSAGPGPGPGPRPARAVLALALDAGPARLLRSAGAEVLTGPRPDPAQVREAVAALGAREVVLLVDAAVAGALDPAAQGCDLEVVETCSPLQALAALAVLDQDAPLGEVVAGMRRAAGAVRWAEVRRAVRQADGDGALLGRGPGGPDVTGPSADALARDLLGRLLSAGPELVTLVVGDGLPEGLADALADDARRGGAEVEVLDGRGGGPLLLLGAE